MSDQTLREAAIAVVDAAHGYFWTMSPVMQKAIRGLCAALAEPPAPAHPDSIGPTGLLAGHRPSGVGDATHDLTADPAPAPEAERGYACGLCRWGADQPRSLADWVAHMHAEHPTGQMIEGGDL